MPECKTNYGCLTPQLCRKARECVQGPSEGSLSESRGPMKVVDAVPTGSLPVLDAEGLAKLWDGEAYATRSQATRPGYNNMTTLSRTYAKADQLEKCALELRLLMARTNQRQPEENNQGVAGRDSGLATSA